MGGKPIKPKIQAYVDQRWFDEFEVYRASHDLNQSKALQKILAEFFGGASASTLQPDGLDTVATSALVDALRSELIELRYELDHRLQLIESRLAIESADKSAVGITESASESATLTDESASESATGQDESVVDLDGLATESATKQAESAIVCDESAIESAEESAMIQVESGSESAIGQDESAIESAIIEDVVIAALQASSPLVAQGELPDNTPESQADQGDRNTLEDIPAPSNEPVKEAAPRLGELAPLSSVGLAKRLKVNASNVSRAKDKGDKHFRRWTASLDPNGIAWEYRPNESLKYHPLNKSVTATLTAANR